MSPVDFKSFLQSKSNVDKIMTHITTMSEEDDWMSSEKIDVLISEIRGLRKDISVMMNEMRNQSYSSDSYTTVQESASRQKPRIVVHKPDAQTVSIAPSNNAFGSDFDDHVAALC